VTARRGWRDGNGRVIDQPPGLVPTATGTEGDDVLPGTNGRDVVMGLGGDDELRGTREQEGPVS
jgi:RTX calcium-binding nonapeptide repeat (4 copies)